MARLQVIVDKTAGEREREAMALLTAHIQGAIGGYNPRMLTRRTFLHRAGAAGARRWPALAGCSPPSTTC